MKKNIVGTNLRALRKRKNLSQEELAAQFHVTRQTISNWENGVSEPDFRTLCGLAAILRCDFIPRHTENTADLQPTERKMRVILGDSSKITVKFPENACEITAGTIDLLINGSDFLGNAVKIHVIAPFSLEFPVEHS